MPRARGRCPRPFAARRHSVLVWLLNFVTLFRGNQRPFMFLMARLAAALSLRFVIGRRRFGMGMDRTGRQRRILRRLPFPLAFQLLDSRFQLGVLRQQQTNDRLGFRRLACDDLFGDRVRHAHRCRQNPPARPDQFLKKRPPGRERLHQVLSTSSGTSLPHRRFSGPSPASGALRFRERSSRPRRRRKCGSACRGG